MTLVSALLLAAFRILSPQDAASLKIGTIDDPAKAFAAYSEGFDGVAAETVPTPNLLQTWRKLSIPVYAKVAFDAEGSAEFFRKQCGIMPYAAGADGVILSSDPKTLPPGWQAALEAAREDVRLSERLQSLADRCRASKNAQIVLAGRRIGNWFAETPFARENVDTIRLETVGLVRQLETLLGEKPCAAETAVAKTEPNTLDFTPFKDREFEKVRIEGFGKEVKLGPGVTLTVTAAGFLLRFCDPTGAFNPNGLPPGRDTFRVKLYLPTRRTVGWERHDIVITAPQKPTPRADSSCTDQMAIGIADRFANCRARCYEVPSRTWSEDYQMLHVPSEYVYLWMKAGKDSSTGWKLDVTFPFSDIVGQWPFSEEPRRNLWYLSVDRFADGSAGKAFRLQFPKGNARFHAQMCAAFNCAAATSAWNADSAETRWVWRAPEAERLLPAVKTDIVNRYSREEDNLFWTRMVEPLYRRAQKSSETALCDKDHTNPKFASLPSAKQVAFVASSEPYRHIYEIASRLRRDFLLMRAKGETPPEPKADALKEEEDKLKKPASLSVDEGETMSLDEETL